MQAPAISAIGDRDESRVRGSCLTAGCPCKDPRIVSSRRAAFFAARARQTGETSDRFVEVEHDWRIPFVPVTESEGRRMPIAGQPR